MVGFEPTSGGVKVRSLNRLATPQNTYLNSQTIKLLNWARRDSNP